VPRSIRPIVPRTCDRPASSLHVRVASSELLRASSARTLSGRATCQGFCPPRDITGARPLTARRPKPRYVPSSGDHSLSTVCSALRLQGLFHPRAASRARPVQGLLSPRSANGSSPPAASSPLPQRVLDGPCEPEVHTSRASTSRRSSARRRVLASPVISRSCGRSPPRVHCSSRRTTPTAPTLVPQLDRS
jgi:hypothetical protein